MLLFFCISRRALIATWNNKKLFHSKIIGHINKWLEISLTDITETFDKIAVGLKQMITNNRLKALVIQWFEMI